MTDESPKSKVDPGWNDPPLFSYDTHQAHAQSSKRSNLTKRVAFPSSSVSSSDDASRLTGSLLPGGNSGISPLPGPPPIGGFLGPISSSPPVAKSPPNCLSSLPQTSPSSAQDLSSLLPSSCSQSSASDTVFSGSQTKLASEDSNFDCEIDIGIITEGLDKLLEELREKDSETTLADVKKRFQILEQLWGENKFNSIVKKKVQLLVEALIKRDFASAVELQKSLMVDYPSVCSPWMAGIRHLTVSLTCHPKSVNTLQNQSESEPVS